MIAPSVLSLAALVSTSSPDEASRPAPTTLYLNFEGGRVAPGTNAALGEVSCANTEVVYPDFGYLDRDGIEILAAEVERILAPYAINVVWREPPPPHLPYTVAMMGGSAELLTNTESAKGSACDIDCGNQNPRDMVFVFVQSIVDPWMAAKVVAHEAGHSWGLEHVATDDDIMSPFVEDDIEGWVDDCAELTSASASACPDQQQLHCSTGQNSHAELMRLFGPREVDEQAPEVSITAPEDGAVLPLGESLSFEVDVEDDRGGYGWLFEIPEAGWQYIAYDKESAVPLTLPEGEYTLRVRAIDQGYNTAEDEIRIEIRPSENSDAEDDGAGAQESDDGCSLTPHQGPSWGLLAFVLGFGILRKRRRESCFESDSRRTPTHR